MSKQKETVYVGLSGGVDSSVSALLLQEEGFNVVGVFIRVWYPPFIDCDWKEERRDAMRVCTHLNIPFKELDAQEEYKRDVVDYMIAEYKKGRTPNPDVMCNRSVKFGVFKDWALEEGADYIATGHYARIEKEDDHYLLKAGIDENKDQSYFLWTLTQDDLKRILFPVGGIKKEEVRKRAQEANLFTAEKKDSQGICFLGNVDMKEFLSHYIETKTGDVLNEAGDIIGTHNGAELYTIGERRGFEVTKKTPNDKPRYVTAKNIKENTITVSERAPDTQTDATQAVTLEKVNWIHEKPDEEKYHARVRYRQTLQECKVAYENEVWKVTFATPQESVACGQSLVLYKEDVCCGGGVISYKYH